MMTTVSIALCTYNGELFLQRQLDTLVAQSILPHEVVICDDASSDRSLEIAKSFARTAPFPVHIHQNSNNLGYIKNFEKAISLCSQDIVAMCDQDDVWAPQKIEQILQILDAEPQVGLVLHDFFWIDGKDHPWSGPVETYGPHSLSSSQLPKEIETNSIAVFMQPYPRAWCGCMMAFRRSFSDIILPIFPGKGHDDWILKILAPITETRFIASPLIQYRMHERNTNRRDLEKRTPIYLWKRFKKNVNRMLKGYTKRNFYKQIIHKLHCSKYKIKYPFLISLYQKYT